MKSKKLQPGNRRQKVLYGVPSDVALWHPVECVSVSRCTNDLSETDIHPGVHGGQMAIVGLSIFQLHQHRVSVGGFQEGQWQHYNKRKLLSSSQTSQVFDQKLT